MKQFNIKEAKGKRAAARELANQRAAEREEEVKNMRERRQKEEEFNDEMVWNIQTPFSVTQKSKDESKVKDSNVNGTKNIEEESKWEEATWEEAKWEEAVQKKEEHEKDDKHEKTAQIEQDGKEHGEGTLTCRASTSSFESHSEAEERDMRKSIDDKRRKGNRHGKRKRSHLSNTSGSGPDSSAEEGEVKSDNDSKSRKTSKKKTKKSKHNRDRDTRNVVVNDHQPISDLPKIPKLKHDSRRVEDRERYERGSGYNDLRHVIQVKRSYENPRYEMYWDEYSRRWVEYRPDWTAAWEQHRTYEQQLYAADWGRQNSGNSHRYLKERSWENFTVKRERSPIFDRRKSRERSTLDKRDIGWEATIERDRRNRDTRDKDRKESRQDRKRDSHTTTRSNSSGTDSQRRERSQDKSRDKDRKEKSKNDNQSNEKNFVRSSRTNGRDKHGRFNETSEKQKPDNLGNKSKERKSRDSVKSEKTATGGKIVEKNDRLKKGAENRKTEEKGKERTKENIDLIAKSNKIDYLEKKKKKKEKPVKVKGKKEKKEKEKKVKKKKDELIILPDVKETLRIEKEEDLEKKLIIDKPRTNDTSEKHEETSMNAIIDPPCKHTDVKSGPAEIKDVVSSLKNIVKKSNDKTSNSPRISTHTTELEKRTKEPIIAFQQAVKVDEPYDPFEPTASPSISNSSPCSPFQALSPPPSSKRKLSSDLDSLNNSTDSAFGGLKHPKIENVKPLPDVKISKPLTKPFNDILPQLATQDGSKLNQLIDKFVNKSGKATLDSKETDAEKALPGSSKFATSAKKSIIFNAPSPNESDSEFDFNNDDEEIESSAVELQNKNSRERQYLKKLHHQERVVEEVKLAIKPYYQRKEIDKHDYKEILKRSVNQVCHSKSGEINPVKIRKLIDGYVKKFQLKKKHVEKGGKEKKKPSSLTELKKKR
ncbi:trichohyalin-like [Anneissia japonica]|uniref:trichohyalin-like n=1 Tax=Anneissia japonica TaxID=1529436 RepID=UPI00142560AA|nr:trichohyalin-like [Anneissia japonica]